ncbi:RNA-binding (RRM/RBD/RNP motifs) family protein [Artemisia annua]|uniref:RNA-binding (RRM/RBD/RNP motifs) family protein n=1 Tax=Artemisia annua TaxID=35608 RepID=A0A2U1Q425_ARTAN|nr:RNA-binding (RRM/RBD/RNP motifs) family protein [Artemisia annua]
MAFSSAFRRVVNGSSSIVTSPSFSARFSSTLTAPKLFISGLNRNTTDEKLREAFAPFGQLVEGKEIIFTFSKVIMDRPTQRSKGFAFVTYASIEEAEKAREGMNAKFLDGWVIFVDPAKPKEYRPPPQPESQQSSELGFRTNKTIAHELVILHIYYCFLPPKESTFLHFGSTRINDQVIIGLICSLGSRPVQKLVLRIAFTEIQTSVLFKVETNKLCKDWFYSRLLV